MDLAEFLLARIAEDEEVAHAAEHVRLCGPDGVYTNLASVGSVDTYVRWTSSDQRGHHIEGTALMRRFDAARVLAECAAKRAIIHQAVSAIDDPWTYDMMARNLAEDVLLALAQPCADHPDFHPEWTLMRT